MEAAEHEQQEVSLNTQNLAGKYLTFALGKEEYGIGILKVKEIIGMMEITAVPQTPAFVKGVINLRGSVIPVLELRTKFGMPIKEYDDRTCIIVSEVQGGSGQIQVGMIVDSVSEVLNVRQEDIEPPPVFGGASVDTSNILGMAKMKGEVKILLDVEHVVSEGMLEHFQND
ncbi:MAG: purine-binding chemotaxis protein CheW [Desulfobulbaceae bacterium]|uniref:Chemotaxis protein CheW n=1 Tax=Candidatus Desulfobia pelagia TaxID=2841692 RepID=A0A8J6NH37_9BACT|nr:purine-binding chemotaxis protein CheW [Candidatus Desulfobia pelagia]